MNGCSFQQVSVNLGWFFVLTLEKLLLRSFILKPSERAQVFLNNGNRHFQNNPPFERSACFYVIISGNFERSQTLEQIFWKTKTFFKKNWRLEQRFLVESTKIETHHFHTKLLCQKSILRQTVMQFGQEFLILWKNYFQFKNLSYRVYLMNELSKCPYSYFL